MSGVQTSPSDETLRVDSTGRNSRYFQNPGSVRSRSSFFVSEARMPARSYLTMSGFGLSQHVQSSWTTCFG